MTVHLKIKSLVETGIFEGDVNQYMILEPSVRGLRQSK